ncbi:MAG: DUF5685 family protein [Eubacteriales bacterium]|nr:DUF5685 family protein [Eubacteriales bacterium]
MFGYVTASLKELTEEQKKRYGAVYCGICRGIRAQSGEAARLCLRYDMAFLALLLMSLYEPQERSGKGPCITHPIAHRPWVDSPYVRYAAAMNVALAYYNCLDDWTDEGKTAAKAMARVLEKRLPPIEAAYPRQCGAIRTCLDELSRLEQERCPNPDLPAGAFGRLMGELLVYEQDMWAEDLRGLGDALGRFIYLLDGVLDYDRDVKKAQYNPFAAMGAGKDWDKWEDYLVSIMGRCTRHFERLPLVQDKAILDNILYSGVWVQFRNKRKGEQRRGGSL